MAAEGTAAACLLPLFASTPSLTVECSWALLGCFIRLSVEPLRCLGLHTGRSREEAQRLLSIIIVGGGPTGVEVAGAQLFEDGRHFQGHAGTVQGHRRPCEAWVLLCCMSGRSSACSAAQLPAWLCPCLPGRPCTRPAAFCCMPGCSLHAWPLRCSPGRCLPTCLPAWRLSCLHVHMEASSPLTQAAPSAAGELSNLIRRDLQNLYPDRARAMS